MKKFLLGLAVLFLGFWLFTRPRNLAEAVQSSGGQLWELTVDLFRALIQFFSALT
jgi:hypothetical protein